MTTKTEAIETTVAVKLHLPGVPPRLEFTGRLVSVSNGSRQASGSILVKMETSAGFVEFYNKGRFPLPDGRMWHRTFESAGEIKEQDHDQN